MEEGTLLTASAPFYLPGAAAPPTAVWDWGDGTSSPGIVSEADGSGSVEGSHVYAVAGVFTVKLTVTAESGASGESVFRYVVVYDPRGGFVTGGGWIDSPTGAYAPVPALAGKASFGFVSKYKKGADTPSGETEFRFKAGDLSFHSTSYDWLVIAGARAIYKGLGTINGSGEYGFMLSAIDGQVTGGGDVDRFRIKIWDRATEQVIYDNQTGDPEDADATDAIEGGSIVIHKDK
jgi:PKD repeat protein